MQASALFPHSADEPSFLILYLGYSLHKALFVVFVAPLRHFLFFYCCSIVYDLPTRLHPSH